MHHDTGSTTAAQETQDRDGCDASRRLAPPSGIEEYQADPDADGTSADDGVADLQRRDYLKAVGAAGIAGSLAGATSGTAAAQSDWEDEADQRIQEHRTGDLEVQVVDEETGAAVSGADVEVEMQAHEYGFGTAVDANELLNSGENSNYVQELRDNFNKAVLENAHKWRFWEDNQQRADDATQWLIDEGFEVRGHTCIWGARQHDAVPADVETAIDNRNADEIERRTMDHIEDIVTHYGDDIVEWDVVNEALHEHSLQVGVYGDQINHGDDENVWEGEVVPWRSELLADWYEHAEQFANQEGVDIAVNDFNTLVWGYTQDWYPEQIDHLEDSGIDVDSIGFQAHIQATTGEPFTDDNPDGRLSYDQINEVLSIYEDYDADLKITEFDTADGDDWNGDQEKAETLRTYLKTWFAHPDTTDFLMWGFWDGNHWRDDAPLFDSDWSEKPGYQVWRDLVFGEWWTEESGTTGSDGTFAVDAFLGEHDVTVSTDQGEATAEVSVTDADGTTTVEVPVPSDGGSGACGDGAESETVDGNTVCNVDSDQYFRDHNADGEVTQSDVSDFFSVQHREAYRERPGMFDYDGDGSVGLEDVLELFDAA